MTTKTAFTQAELAELRATAERVRAARERMPALYARTIETREAANSATADHFCITTNPDATEEDCERAQAALEAAERAEHEAAVEYQAGYKDASADLSGAVIALVDELAAYKRVVEAQARVDELDQEYGALLAGRTERAEIDANRESQDRALEELAAAKAALKAEVIA